MDKFNELREKYPIFIYNSYEINETGDSFEITYKFETPGLSKFNPTWSFPKAEKVMTDNDKKVFERMVFSLGMVEAISYIKATCSPKFIVNAGSLNEEQIAWYKKLYINGLGEFFYVNGILDAMNIDTFLEIEVSNKTEQPLKLEEKLTGNLIPVGGGKDSAVSIEVLQGMDNMCFIVNPRGASLSTCIVAGYENKIYAPKRTLDKKLFELNEQGFLNGHTPFSAILAFSSYLASLILGRKNIVLSNEASANEANVANTNINHQYSKSIEFENDFREYVEKYICADGPNYFSLLRPISEWQIAKAFIKNPKYFEIFKSCNVGSREDIWCENCPKCLYVYIMLKAFLNETDMKKIFKENLLDKESLKDTFNGLVYPDYDKPFECVGTKDEINLSLSMIVDRLKKENKELPVLLKTYKSEIKDLEKEIQTFENYWNSDNNLKEEFKTALINYLK